MQAGFLVDVVKLGKHCRNDRLALGRAPVEIIEILSPNRRRAAIAAVHGWPTEGVGAGQLLGEMRQDKGGWRRLQTGSELRPLAGVEMLRAKHQQQWPASSLHVSRIAEPMRLQPTHHLASVRHGLRGGQGFAADHVLYGLVLVARGELQARALEVLHEVQRVAMDHRVVVVLADAVPVENRAVDAGKFHEQRVALERVRVIGIIRADQRPIMRSQLEPTADDLVRLKLVHRPVPTPLAAEGLGFVPRHVMNEDQRPLGRRGRDGQPAKGDELERAHYSTRRMRRVVYSRPYISRVTASSRWAPFGSLAGNGPFQR